MTLPLDCLSLYSFLSFPLYFVRLFTAFLSIYLLVFPSPFVLPFTAFLDLTTLLPFSLFIPSCLSLFFRTSPYCLPFYSSLLSLSLCFCIYLSLFLSLLAQTSVPESAALFFHVLPPYSRKCTKNSLLRSCSFYFPAAKDGRRRRRGRESRVLNFLLCFKRKQNITLACCFRDCLFVCFRGMSESETLMTKLCVALCVHSVCYF